MTVIFIAFVIYICEPIPDKSFSDTFDFRYERVMVRNELFRRRVEKGTNLARFPGQL